MDQLLTKNAKTRVALMVLFGAMVLAGAVVADKLISRQDRIAWDQRVVDLKTVRDALLRHEYVRGALPATVAELVPMFLNSSQVTMSDGSSYAYRPLDRTIAMAEDMSIRGLLPRTRPALVFDLPVPETCAPRHSVNESPGPAPTRALPTTLTPTAAVSSTGGSGTGATVTAPSPTTNAMGIPAAPLEMPVGPNGLDAPPPGAYVFEAEHWSEMNYAWEIYRDPDLGGGAGITCREGRTTGSAQCYFRTYNFYDIREHKEQSVLRYFFHIPKAGRYRVAARFWATCTHCSNAVNVGLDRGGLDIDDPSKHYYGVFLSSRIPFRWRWVKTRASFTLDAGEHYLQVFPHEDGMQIDQFMLIPAGSSDRIETSRAFMPNLAVNDGTAFAEKTEHPLSMSFDFESMVIGASMPADIRLVLRRIRKTTGTATIRVRLREAGTNGSDRLLGRYTMNLEDLPELSFVTADFSGIDYGTLPRREYLLVAELESDACSPVACRVPLMHPFVWTVSPMLPFYANEQAGPLDGDANHLDGQTASVWAPLADRSWTPLGVLDFGMQTVTNSLNAPILKTIYAQTTIHVPASGVYLIKAQADDQMVVWLDGVELARISTRLSVIRNVGRFEVPLKRGDHRLRIRVNQGGSYKGSQRGGYWQASLRFRTSDDDLSNIVGIEPNSRAPDANFD